MDERELKLQTVYSLEIFCAYSKIIGKTILEQKKSKKIGSRRLRQSKRTSKSTITVRSHLGLPEVC